VLYRQKRRLRTAKRIVILIHVRRDRRDVDLSPSSFATVIDVAVVTAAAAALPYTGDKGLDPPMASTRTSPSLPEAGRSAAGRARPRVPRALIPDLLSIQARRRIFVVRVVSFCERAVRRGLVVQLRIAASLSWYGIPLYETTVNRLNDGPVLSGPAVPLQKEKICTSAIAIVGIVMMTPVCCFI
jgi:hypothetical protein